MAWWNRRDDEPPEEPTPSDDDDATIRVPASSELFEDWLDAMHPNLTGFVDFRVPPEVEPDFSRESLGRLEALLLDQYGSGDDILAPDANRSFVDGAVRYIGETFLRHSGGGWRYDTRPEAVVRARPFIVVDSDTPTPVSPFHLMIKAVNRRSGTFLTEIFDRQHANAQQRAEREGRSPVRTAPDGTPETSEAAPVPASEPDLAGFLETMESELDRWTADVVPPAQRWDRSRESLLTLAEVFLDRFSDVDALAAADSEPLVQGAIRYVGDTLIRAGGGAWQYRPGEKDEYNPFVGRYYVAKGEDDDAITKVPEITLRNVVRRRDPQPLLTAFDQWTAE